MAGHDTERDESRLRRPVRSGSIWFARAHRDLWKIRSNRTGTPRCVDASLSPAEIKGKANLDKETTRERKEADDNARDKEEGGGVTMGEKGWRRFLLVSVPPLRNHARMYRRSLGRSERGERGGFFGKTAKRRRRGAAGRLFVATLNGRSRTTS